MLDLIPDVEEKTDQIKEEIKESYNFDLDYPVAQFVICCGFFLILTVEQVVHYIQESAEGDDGESQPLLSPGSTTSYQATPTHSQHSQHHHPSQLLQHSSLRSIMLLLAL